MTSAQGEPERQRSVSPKEDGRARENGQEEGHFGVENRPKDIEISDRLEPKQIDQKVSREADGDQAGADDATGHHNVSPSHIEPPSGCSLRSNGTGLTRQWSSFFGFSVTTWVRAL
jgi:hypothetical protein